MSISTWKVVLFGFLLIEKMKSSRLVSVAKAEYSIHYSDLYHVGSGIFAEQLLSVEKIYYLQNKIFLLWNHN